MKNKLLWLISNIKVKKNLIIFMVTVLAAIGITVIRSLYVPAYEITINGENIGAVADTQYLSRLLILWKHRFLKFWAKNTSLIAT